MTKATLNYIYDPLCGWCYGASPLASAAQQIEGLEIKLFGGGMMQQQPVTPELRGFVKPHDQRIAQLTGQEFGTAYSDGLLNDTTAVLDSFAPISAVMAAIACGTDGVDLLKAIQEAHYLDGRKTSETAVLIEIAVETGLDREAFSKALDSALQQVNSHTAAASEMLFKVGRQGFPTFILELDGHLTLIEASPYYRRPEQWKQALEQTISGS